MDWNKEGKYIEGVYLKGIFVQGVVKESRIKYGGRVQHRVLLDTPVIIYGTERDVLLIDDENITMVIRNQENK